jgi:hypothetical protein
MKSKMRYFLKFSLKTCFWKLDTHLFINNSMRSVQPCKKNRKKILRKFWITRTSLLSSLWLFFWFLREYCHSHWIKLILYVFVCKLTISVSAEWCHFKQISIIAKLISAYLCSILIILQFFSSDFMRKIFSINLDILSEWKSNRSIIKYTT